MKQTEHFWMICCHGLQVYRRTSENKINSQQAARAAYSCQGTLYGAFTAELLERLEEAGCSILSTPEYGAVKVGKKIQVYGYKK